MKSAPKLSRLLPVLSLATLGLLGIDSPVRVATAKVQIEQPEKQTDGDPEDYSEGSPRRITPNLAKPPTEPSTSTYISRTRVIFEIARALLRGLFR